MDPRLCSVCRGIFENPEHRSRIRETAEALGRGEMCAQKYHSSYIPIIHHASSQSFRNSVNLGCPICVVLMASVRWPNDPTKRHELPNQTTYRLTLDVRGRYIGIEEYGPPSLLVFFDPGPGFDVQFFDLEPDGAR